MIISYSRSDYHPAALTEFESDVFNTEFFLTMMLLREGPEEVKWELGFAYFQCWDWLGFSCLLSLGMAFFKCQWEWENILRIATGISRYFVNEMDFVTNNAGKMESGSPSPPPPSGPSIYWNSEIRKKWDVSWQSVALDSQDREFHSHRRPWSCIFRNSGSRLSLRKCTHSQKYPYRLPLLVIECKMPILFLILKLIGYGCQFLLTRSVWSFLLEHETLLENSVL